MANVLIIEDDFALSELLRNMIEGNGYTVKCSYEGADGISKAVKTVPDLIILDIELPDMNGLELLETLKQTQATKAIPVIMSSANDMVGSVDKAFKLGAVGYILKPFKKEVILNKLKEILKDKTK